MCALLAIVQYEVHYFQDKRWIVNSRYPGDQRLVAIKDAAIVEDTTRRPTKVVKETYFPDENRSETVTVYVGTLLKAAMDKVKTQPPKPLYQIDRTRKAAALLKGKILPRTVAPQAADLFWRVFITIGFSLAAATIVTLALSWIMSRLPDFGIIVDPARSSAILTLTYVGFFFFGTFSLFRFGAPIKRMIAAFWRSSEMESARQAARAAMPAMKFKPKHKNQTPFEREKDIADVKRLRGDPDSLPPELTVIHEEPAIIQDSVTEFTPDAADERMKHIAEIEKMRAEQLVPAQGPVAQDVAGLPPSLEQNDSDNGFGLTQPEPQFRTAPERLLPPPLTFSPAINELQRGMAMRFVAELVLPQMARELDDPMSRRGVALFVTGAMSQLAAAANLSPPLAFSMVAGAVTAALPRHAVDAFFAHYESQVSAAANVTIIADGRRAMEQFLAGQNTDGALAAGLKAWRVPLTHANTYSTDANAPSDYYLLTEFRNSDAFMMDFHNHVVRQALEVQDGREIKHTGRGILARFEHAELALKAAFAIREKIGSSSGIPTTTFFAVAVVAGFGAADDPLLSASVTKAAQAEFENVPRGTVVCQSVVLHNASTASSLSARQTKSGWQIVSEPNSTPALTPVS